MKRTSRLFWVLIVLIVIGAVFAMDKGIRYLPTYVRSTYISPDLVYNHPLYGYQSKPNGHGWYERDEFSNYIVLNGLGRHDDELSAKEPDTKRIIALGGSFTAGWEVSTDETWPSLLESSLGQGWDVVNMAHQAKKFNYVARILDDAFFEDLQPDYLIIGFAYGRLSPDVDYRPGEMSMQRVGVYRGFVYLYGPGGDQDVKGAIDILSTMSYFPVSIYDWAPWARRSNIVNLMVQAQEKRFLSDHPEYHELKLDGNNIQAFWWGQAHKEASVANTIAHIDRIRAVARQRGIPVMYVFIPSDTCYTNDVSVERLFPIYFKKGDLVADLCPAFRQVYRKTGQRLHWVHDGHPNALGQKVAAISIYQLLRELRESSVPSRRRR